MNRAIRPLLPLLLLLCLALPVAAEPLATFDGQPAQISDYTGKGQWTVVKIWISDCGVCNAEAHAYVAFHAKHKDSDARMLGISLDGREHLFDAEAFVERHALNYPQLLIDWEGGSRMYRELTGASLNGTPAFLIYTPDGELVAQQLGAVPVELIESFIAGRSAR